MNIGFHKTMAVGPKGKDGEQGVPGKDGTGTGTVTKVNGIEPDASGDVQLPIPPAPDLSGLALEKDLKAHEVFKNNPHKVTTKQVNIDDSLILATSPPTDMPFGVVVYQGAPEGGYPDWGTILSIKASYTSSGSLQIFNHYASDNGPLRLRRSTGNDGVWTEWVDIVTSKLPPLIDAVLAAGWTNLGNDIDYPPLTYYKDQFGVVHVNGTVTKGEGATHLATTLPVGYRPLKTLFFYSNLKDGFLSEITVKPSGELSITGSTANTLSVNISFRTD